MGPTITTPRPPATDEAPDRRPVACVAGVRAGRVAERLAAVLSEFGYRTRTVADEDDAERIGGLAGTALLVCHVVRPERDLPVELAFTASHDIEVIALVPAGVSVEGLAAELLADCGAAVVRYDRVEPHRALHARLVDQRSS